ncbi:MAG: DUF4124 domain-containing protein [Deltaproteobacteria bacterium]|nr:DUF4124 domain-containing protein [Deltaproteobacteria bacterium]
MMCRIFLITLFILSLAVASSAEFYKYRDADGVLRFTDNLQDVPKDQREGAQSYQEVKSEPPVSEEAAPEVDEAAGAQGGNTKAYNELKSEKEALDNEYAQIEADRKKLVAMTKSPKNDEEYEAFQGQIKRFNDRVKAYEEKLAIFEQKVEAYNAQAK